VAARSAGVRAVRSKPIFGIGPTARARALRLLLLSTLLYPLLAGCAERQPRADLVIANGAEPESLDPAVATGQPDLRAIAALFEGLTRYNAQSGEPEPGWAERWEISPDGRRYKFFLRANSVWSNGEPLTAEDFVYSWRRALDPATAAEYAGQLFYVKNAEAFRAGKLADPAALGVRALDARALEVELAEPTAFFLSLCAFQTLAVVPRDVIERLGDRWLMQRPLKVSGAYTLEAWRLNDKIRLRKNPRYWDAANTELAVVDLLPLTSPATALNLYETHAVDLVWDKSLVPTELVERLLKRPDFHTFPYLGSYFVRFNVTRKPFDDARVRKAFTQVIDKRRLVEKITKGGEKPARTHVPPGTANYRPPEGLAYDPTAGRRWLAEAGYPGGKGFPNVVYLYNAGRGGGRQDDQLAIELQAMWQAELGVTVELRAMEWKTYLAAQNKLDYELCRSSWVADYNDPNTFLDMFMSNNGNNRTGWRSERYDQLLREANKQTDLAQRAALLRRAEQLLVEEDVTIAPLYFYAGFNYYRTNELAGIYPNVIDQHPLNAIRWLAGGPAGSQWNPDRRMASGPR